MEDGGHFMNDKSALLAAHFCRQHECAGGEVRGVSPAKNGTWDVKGDPR